MLRYAILVALASQAAVAQNGNSRWRPLGAEAYAGVSTLFAYDVDHSLDARIVDSVTTSLYRRERIVFTGADGYRVPAYLAVPKRGGPRFPVVLALHATGSSKDDWWRDDSYERGGLITSRLLEAGIAVLALDAHFHGERAIGNDYDSFQAMLVDRQWFNLVRDGLLLTVKDYRHALDYLGTRGDIDTSRVGAIGCSLGGMMTLHLAAFDPRIDAAVGCAAALDDGWLYPIAPINIAPGLGRTPLLLIGGRDDPLASDRKMTALYDAIAGKKKRLLLFDAGHQLPAAYADSAAKWLMSRLR